MVVAVPQRAPKRCGRRFEADHPNTRWQMDGFEVTLSTGIKVMVLHILDDCSRFDLACHVASSENAHDVWAAFTTAAAAYGLPAQLQTDNGTAFSGKRRGWTSALEANCLTLGIRHIPSSVGHPQTCGKVERAHKTTRKWLRSQPLAGTPEELQTQLDTYRVIYNEQRRKTHLGGLTPDQRFRLGPRDGPGPDTLTAPFLVTECITSTSGCIGIDGTLVGIGRPHAGQPATVFRQGDRVTVFIGNEIAAEIVLDRRRRYQRQSGLELPMS
ncbi:unannotated protein [freshwater metagenome]|uniref:Unannotated protein n=1 Tax=freshwater metagenome TaxID=449393 RepID=A0A6J6PD12_9ZZZZ